MKKILYSIVLAFALIISVQVDAQVTSASIADTSFKIQQLPGRNFVDTNKDGVCDNWSSRPANGRGGQFVDANNDGICDRFTQGNRQGTGRNQGCFRGNGHGPRYGFRKGRCGYRNNQVISQPSNDKPTK